MRERARVSDLAHSAVAAAAAAAVAAPSAAVVFAIDAANLPRKA